MSIAPKPFQKASIDAALRALTRKKGSRRYLVADEVGLGKTIVASGVIQELVKKKKLVGNGPLSVLYVCSNQAIAKQNTLRLLSFLPKDNRKSAVATVDRPSLLSTRPRPTHPGVHIYMLTPDTAIPTRKGQRSDGRLEERALAFVLLHRILSLQIIRLYRTFRRRAGSTSFGFWVRHYRKQDASGALGGGEFRNGFNVALRSVLGLEPGQHLPPVLNRMLDEKLDQNLVAACRTALAIAALTSIGPSLVVFDEFQKFRDLMEEVEIQDADGDEANRSRAAAKVLESIRGLPDGSGPALLLLSATPYTPYRKHAKHTLQDRKATDQSSDFFDLVAFLAASPRVADAARGKFQELSEELRKGVFDSDRAKDLRSTLMEILLPFMSRTERPEQSGGQEQPNDTTSVVDADLLPSDIAQFCDMQACFSEGSVDWVVPLWQSVPLPMQTLGSRYQAWTTKEKMPDVASLTAAARDAHRVAAPWPHPRVRALMSKLSEKRLSMPWTAPSLPWWPLRAGWKVNDNDKTIDGKLLVFSRYKAVPTALSGLISYSTESKLLASKHTRSKVNYEAASKRRWLQPTPDRPGLLELFHPSILLAKLDPLAVPLGNFPAMKREVERQLRAVLKQLDVRVVPGLKLARRKPWEILVALEVKAGLWEASQAAWDKVAPVAEDADSVGRLRAMMTKWKEVAIGGQDICEISAEAELGGLVTLALESPGVVFLRALARHWPEATNAKHLPSVLSVVWNGLRSYLDKSWFVAALGDREGSKYPSAIRNAVIDGNLESVLDEHFWFLSMDSSDDWLLRLEEVEKSLRLRDANVTFHEGGDGSENADSKDSSTFTIRCHVAVPLTEGRKLGSSTVVREGGTEPNTEDSSLRPDEIRKAFNSPFWPNVLVTTSIGQEGLDLHPWCRALAHWDLATSAVALEQREGRITRFGSLSVRRAIARKLCGQLDTAEMGSPWHRLARLANDQLSDTSGLSPWWVVEGSQTDKFYLTIPGGEQQERYESLARERALYRLVLGMPDQTDLIRLLDAREQDPDALRRACIDLSAYNHKIRRGQ